MEDTASRFCIAITSLYNISLNNMSNKDGDEGSCYSYVQEDNEPNDIPKSIITTTPISKEKKKKKRKHSSTGGDDTASSLVTDSLVSSGSKKKKKKKDKKRKSKDNRASSGTNDWQPPAGLPPDNSQQHQEQQQLSPPSTDEILKLASQKLSQHQQQTSGGSIFSLIAKPTTANNNNSKLKKSPYQVKTILGTVALLPTSLPNVPKCIKSLLQTLLLMYDSNMGGVLLSLDDDIKLLPVDYKAPSSSRGGSSSSNNNSGLIGGRIVDDLPYIHYKFQINGLLFCPTLNMKLTGQVIECTQTYITLTTHHILSTKISTEKLQDVGFYYNETSFEWERKNDTLGGPLTTIYLDDKVDFIVERIHECGGYISLDGMRPEVSTLG